MTALDTRARALAAKSLAKNGKEVTYTHRVPGAYNTATGTKASTETVYTVKVLFIAPTKRLLDRGVLVDELVAILAASDLPVDPVPNDRITFDGKSYTLRPIEPVWSGEQVALWYLAFKKD